VSSLIKNSIFSALEKYYQNPKNFELSLHGKELRCQKKTSHGTNPKVLAFLKEFFKNIPCDSKKEFTIYLDTLQKMPKGETLISRQIPLKSAQKIKALWNQYKKEKHSKEGIALFQKLLSYLPKEQTSKKVPPLPKAQAPKQVLSLSPEAKFLDRIRALHTLEELQNYAPQLPAVQEEALARPDLYSPLFQVERFIATTKKLRGGPHGKFIEALQREFLDKFSKRQSVLSCFSHLGAFQHLLEQGRLPSPLTSAALDAEVKKRCQKIVEPWQKKDKILNENICVQWENTLAQNLAKLLVNKNGTINTFLIPAIRKHSIKRPHQGIPLWSRLDNALIELKNNPNLVPLLEAAKIPPAGSQGEKIIRDTLLLPEGEKISKAHVIRTLLSAIFAPWFQSGLGSCHTTALLMAARSASLEMTVKEYREILENGKLSRIVNGKARDFPGIYRIATRFFKKEIALSTQKEVEQCTETLCSIPHVHSTLSLLVGNKNRVHTVVSSYLKKLYRNLKDFSFSAFLKEIQKKYKPKDALYTLAKRRLAASYNHPLLRTWENSAAGMHYFPLTREGYQGCHHEQRAFAEALIDTFTPFVSRFEYSGSGRLLPDEWTICDNIYFSVVPEDAKSALQTILLFKDTQGKLSEIKNVQEFGKLLQKIYNGLPNRKPLTENSDALVKRFLKNYHPAHGSQKTPWLKELYVSGSVLNIPYLLDSDIDYPVDNPGILSVKKCDRTFLKQLRKTALSLRSEKLHSKNISLPAENPSHVFRVLPLHPSLTHLPRIQDADQWISQMESKILSLKTGNLCQEITKKIKEKIISFTEYFPEIKIKNPHMLKVVQPSPKSSLSSWLQKVGTALEIHFGKNRIISLEGEKVYLNHIAHNIVDCAAYEVLLKKMPKDFGKMVIHFAHLNFLELSPQKNLIPKHVCLLFSPSRKAWTVQTVLSDNSLFFPENNSAENFSEGMSYSSPEALQPLKEYALRKKQILLQEKRNTSRI
jgi:hypothetical protein